MPSGRRTTYEYDAASGGLSRIKLPNSNSAITISVQSSILGLEKVYLGLPGNKNDHVTYWRTRTTSNDDARGASRLLVQVRPPAEDGNVVHRYSPQGRLLQSASGDGLSLYNYDHVGFLAGVSHQNREWGMKTTFVRNVVASTEDDSATSAKSNGLRFIAQETRINFEAKSGLASAKFDYEYTTSGLTDLVIKGRIGAQTLPSHYLHHGWARGMFPISGLAKGNGRFVVHTHDLNVTSITDGEATFSRSKTSDVLVISGREAYRAEYAFDLCGKLESSFMRMVKSSGGGQEFRQTRRFSYDADGQLERATIVDTSEWRYDYDSLGNLLSSVASGVSGRGSVKRNLAYDEHGRLTGFKGEPRQRVSYDENGRIISDLRNNLFTYTTSDCLSTVRLAGNERTIQYYYDHMDRLIARKDNAGNVTQFFYGFPTKPLLVSHVYRPRDGTLTSLVYGDDDRLIFVSIGSRKFYVVSDWLGSPMLFFTPSGDVVREVTRTPYGEITYDSNPGLNVPIGFGGAIHDPEANLLHFQVISL